VNQYETNAMSEKFVTAGYEITNKIEEAQVCVINTCSVTNVSDRKSRQTIRKVKEKNEKLIIIVTGCYAQVAKEDIKQMPEVDLIIGNNEKKDIIQYLEKFIKQNPKQIIEVQDAFEPREFADFGTITYTEKTRAAIKVQDGCDRFCSYCIIPYARGRVRSRNPESIIKEIEEVTKRGIKEVVITGIHIASYGKDFPKEKEFKLIDLLEEINKIEGIKRIRLGSIEPILITDEFIERLIKLEKICHHFHLSLQSGCDETLKRMNRRYSTEEFREVVTRLRKAYNDVILTTDIIVGFPGETEEEFSKTYKFLKEINFYKMHIFPYSARKGTKAAEMSNQIDGLVKERRSKILIDLSNKNQLEYNKTYIGKKIEVLVEEGKGHTANYILVKGMGEDKSLENKLINLKITEANIEYLQGNIL
jgi:threonylcarbamoyladenosine tRNA methylthiotransferase MtaB